MISRYALLAIAFAIGCQNGTTKPAAGSGSAVVATPPAVAKDIDSKAILARADVADDVYVKHVLISWKELASTYNGGQDPRGAARSNADAASLAQDVLAKLTAHPEQIDELAKQYSEDPGSKDSGQPYELNKDTQFVPEFKQLSLRLKDNEAGIVKTQFGYHIIERVGAPALDPFESAEILARPATHGQALIEQVMIGWVDAPGAKRLINAPKRSKAEADQLAHEAFQKAKAGEDMAKLMKDYSDDLESKAQPHTYEVNSEHDPLPFSRLAVRMKPGEIGVIKSLFGWHIIKRIAPPASDPLDSTDILKRDAVAQKVKVKDLQLGWTDAHSKDPRGAKRSRAAVEQLVKATVAKLANGDKIEPLMAELSEDAKSAKTGEAYEVTADAPLLLEFKNLSLRLNVGEVGVVKTKLGIHIVKRVE